MRSPRVQRLDSGENGVFDFFVSAEKESHVTERWRASLFLKCKSSAPAIVYPVHVDSKFVNWEATLDNGLPVHLSHRPLSTKGEMKR